MKTISCVFVALCLINISTVAGQIISSKKCADLGITPMLNFQKERTMGLWYVQETITWPLAESLDCYTVNFVAVGNTAVLTDTFQVLDLKLKTSVVGVATYDSTGKAVYTYVSSNPNGVTSTVTILSTDYNNYMIEWLCIDKGDHSESIYFVYTRSRTVSSTTQQKIDKVLADNNIDRTKMKKFKQDVGSCVYGVSGGLLGLLLGLVGGILG